MKNTPDAPAPEELAAMLKGWRSSMTAGEAAAMLGVPKRTLEGVEQGRGFRYPRLLALALNAATPNAKNPPPR